MAEAIVAVLTLFTKAFTKIILMLIAVLITFLVIPQSRIAAMLGVAVLSSFAGGMLIETISAERHWTLSMATAVSFSAGFVVFPLMMMFTKFYSLLSSDDVFHQAIYTKVRKLVMNRVDATIDPYMIESKKEIQVVERTKIVPPEDPKEDIKEMRILVDKGADSV